MPGYRGGVLGLLSSHGDGLDPGREIRRVSWYAHQCQRGFDGIYRQFCSRYPNGQGVLNINTNASFFKGVIMVLVIVYSHRFNINPDSKSCVEYNGES